MNINVQSKDVKAVMNKVNKCVSRKPSNLPVLNSVHVSATNGRIVLRATDLSVELTASIPANVIEGGACLIDKKRLLELASGKFGKSLTITAPNDGVVVNGLQLPQQELKDYPPSPAWFEDANTPTDETYVMMGVDTSDLKAVLHAASKDDARPVLQGISTNFKSMAATDGFRISVVQYPNREPAKRSMIISSQIVPVLYDGMLLTFVGYKDWIGTRWEEEDIQYRMIAQAIEGNFPDWQRILPATWKHTCSFNKTNMVEAVTKAGMIAKEGVCQVILNITSDTIRVSAKAEGAGEWSGNVPASNETTGLDIAFNYTFLLDAMKAMPRDVLIFKLNAPNTPAMFEDGMYSEIIMPMHIDK